MSSPTHPASRPAAHVVETGERVSRSAYPSGNAIRRAMRTLRVEGPRSVWFKLLSECGYRRLLLLERPLDEPIADFTPALAVDVAMLGSGEVDEYLAFRSGTLRHDIDDRLRNGQMCFVARHQRRIVAAAWLAVQPIWVSFLGCRIDVEAGEAHVYDKFTMPEYRGRGIANAVRTHHLRHLQRRGFRRATGAVLPENVSSLRDDAKGGFRAYGMLVRIKVGRWQRVFLMPPPRGLRMR
jgi:ribosomal protein S18 acetylase RimI-like enzyme